MTNYTLMVGVAFLSYDLTLWNVFTTAGRPWKNPMRCNILKYSTLTPNHLQILQTHWTVVLTARLDDVTELLLDNR